MKKFAILLTLLPLVALADLVSPPSTCYGQVPIVTLERPGLIFWVVSVAAFVGIIVLTMLIGRLVRKSITEYVVLELLIGMALAGAVLWCGGIPMYRIVSAVHDSHTSWHEQKVIFVDREILTALLGQLERDKINPYFATSADVQSSIERLDQVYRKKCKDLPIYLLKQAVNHPYEPAYWQWPGPNETRQAREIGQVRKFEKER